MKSPLFSVVLIAKNEAKTLPRMLASLTEFRERGGEVIVADTGSSDRTPQIARDAGCEVFEEGSRFTKAIDLPASIEINKRFVAVEEENVVYCGDRLFDFSAARNFAVSRAKNAWVLVADCDEVFTALDIDSVNERINGPKTTQFEYEYVFAHDQYGNAEVQFRRCHLYRRDYYHWRPESVVHEVLVTRIPMLPYAATGYLPPNVLKLEHWQNHETNRSGYLVGLAMECFLHPADDRNSHYFGRELFYSKRYRSAIQEFSRHIGMNKWPVERAQSMIFTGDCFMALEQPDAAVHWWSKAFLADGTRREPLLRLADYFFTKNDPHKVAAFASAALVLPPHNYYMDSQDDYRQRPHELLYWSLFYLGRKEEEEAAYHWAKALKYQPRNPKFLSDAQFFGGQTAIDTVLGP